MKELNFGKIIINKDEDSSVVNEGEVKSTTDKFKFEDNKPVRIVDKKDVLSKQERLFKKLRLPIFVAISLGIGAAAYGKIVDEEIVKIEQEIATEQVVSDEEKKPSIFSDITIDPEDLENYKNQDKILDQSDISMAYGNPDDHLENNQAVVEKENSTVEQDISSNYSEEPAEKQEHTPIVEREINNIGDAFVSVRDELREKGLLPDRIVDDNFLSAVELQESGGDPGAVSDKGAMGTLQVKTIAINDGFKYLKKLQRKEKIDFRGSSMMVGDKSFTEDEMSEMKKLISDNSEYGRAVGEIYFFTLSQGYGMGDEELRDLGVASAQVKLLGAFNAGMDNVKGKDFNEWFSDTKKYCRMVFQNMDNIEKVKKELDRLKLDGISDFAVMNVIKLMNRVEEGKSFMMRKGIAKITKIKNKNPNYTEDDVRITFNHDSDNIISRDPNRQKILKGLIAKND